MSSGVDWTRYEGHVMRSGFLNSPRSRRGVYVLRTTYRYGIPTIAAVAAGLIGFFIIVGAPTRK